MAKRTIILRFSADDDEEKPPLILLWVSQ